MAEDVQLPPAPPTPAGNALSVLRQQLTLISATRQTRPVGFGFFGLVEFGSRNPGNKFGVWLKRHGLWPW